MFTEEETQYLRQMLKTNRSPVRERILDKLDHIGEYTVTLHCHRCGEDLEPDTFAGERHCYFCNKHICDWCYDDNGPFCPDCEHKSWKAEFYEAADVLRDWRMDR